MLYKMITYKNNMEEVFSWIQEKSELVSSPPLPTDRDYSFIQLPEQEDYFNQETSTVQFRFKDISVAQEVSDIFGDGSIEEIPDNN